ncbi:hypothetical protein [Synoicihabitans lomoniglobus]|uniref:Uncharacterized protein n=1 Tax=Synoicihabitans lomoniglobus TaxID=2909285 RepID=A0AAE9ZYB6_9BACT|nr:hypothetical protein [Opitutaceae bacterium LMO-M01]WED64823.1 hypothetical protein PXH66_20960 [Opitutaceae bacterium LMO-M01]
MTSRNLVTLTCVIGALSTAGAYWLGRQHIQLSTSTKSQAMVPATANPVSDPADIANDDSTFATLFDDVRAAHTRGYWSLNLSWQRRFAALSSAQLYALTAFIVDAEPSDARGELRRALYEQWARIDPRAALAHASTIDFVRTRDDAFRSVFRGWAFATASDLDAWVQSEPPGNRRDQGIVALITQADDLPPARLFGYLVESGLLENGGPDTFTLFSTWLRQDPRNAVAQVSGKLEGRSRARVLSSLARVWAGADPQAALAWVQTLPTQEQGSLISTVLGRWARRDPQAAAAATLHPALAAYSDQSLRSVITSWANVDPDSALTWLVAQPVEHRRGEIMGGVLGQLFELTPDAAIRFLENHPEELPHLPERAAQSLGALAKIHPQKAFDFAQQLPAGRKQNQAMHRILGVIAQSDPALALRLVDEPASINVRHSAMAQIMGQIAQQDPETAIAAVQALPSSVERDQALMGIVANLSRTDTDLAEVFAAVLSPGNAQRNAYIQLSNAKLAQDPTAAAQWIDSLADEQLRQTIGSQMAKNWFQQDSQATLAWIQSQSNPSIQDNLYRNVARSWAMSDPAGFSAILLADPTGPLARNLVQGSLGLASASSDIALRTIEQLPEGEVRNLLIRSTIVSLAQSGPRQAQALIATLPPGEVRENAIQNFVSNATRVIAPSQLAAWMQAMPPGHVTPSNYSNLAANYFSRNPDEAVQWIETLPAGEFRDSALQGLSFGPASTGRHEEIGALLLTIADESGREKAITNLLTTWRFNDTAAARAWVDTLPLDDAAKARLLDPDGSGN